MSWRYHAPCLCLRCTGVELEEYVRRPMMSLGIVSMPSRRHKTQVSMLYRETVLPLPTITSTRHTVSAPVIVFVVALVAYTSPEATAERPCYGGRLETRNNKQCPLAYAYFVPYVSASCASSIQTMSPTCCSSRVLGRTARSTEPVACKPPCQTRLFHTDEMSIC